MAVEAGKSTLVTVLGEVVKGEVSFVAIHTMTQMFEGDGAHEGQYSRVVDLPKSTNEVVAVIIVV